MSAEYKKFIRAAQFEDDQLGLGEHLKIAAIAARARMTMEEAQRHAQKMVDDGLASFYPGEPGTLKLDYDAIKFAA